VIIGNSSQYHEAYTEAASRRQWASATKAADEALAATRKLLLPRGINPLSGEANHAAAKIQAARRGAFERQRRRSQRVGKIQAAWRGMTSRTALGTGKVGGVHSVSFAPGIALPGTPQGKSGYYRDYRKEKVVRYFVDTATTVPQWTVVSEKPMYQPKRKNPRPQTPKHPPEALVTELTAQSTELTAQSTAPPAVAIEAPTSVGAAEAPATVGAGGEWTGRGIQMTCVSCTVQYVSMSGKTNTCPECRQRAADELLHSLRANEVVVDEADTEQQQPQPPQPLQPKREAGGGADFELVPDESYTTDGATLQALHASKLQALHRGGQSRREFAALLERQNNTLLSMPGTVQGNSGWYQRSAADSVVCYEISPTSGDWKVVAGPVTRLAFRERERSARAIQ
jgi:hypothetical protein